MHPDAAVNLDRPAMAYIQRSINTYSKKNEYSLQMLLASLLGLRQFSCTHMFQYIAVNTARRIVLETIKARDASAAINIIEPAGRVLDLQCLDVDATAVANDVATRKFMIEQVLEEIYDETDRKRDSEFGYDKEIEASVDQVGEPKAFSTQVLEDIYEETDQIIARGDDDFDPEYLHDEELEAEDQAGESKAYSTEKDILEDILNEEIVGNGSLVINRNQDSAASTISPYSVSMVSPITDYQARGQELKDLNFMEFCLLINKCDREVLKELDVAVVEDVDDGDEVDDSDVDDREDDECEVNNDGDDNSAREAAVVADVLTNIQPTTSRRGPPTNRRFPIDQSNKTLLAHPQVDSKQFMIRSKVKVPLLTGRHVPHYPSSGVRAISTEVRNERWEKEATDWATYFITALVPWNLETSIPECDFSFDGFMSWITKFDNLRLDDPIRVIHEGRVRFLKNCVSAAQTNNAHNVAKGLYREKAADSKVFYQEQQRLGVRHGAGIAGDTTTRSIDDRLRNSSSSSSTDHEGPSSFDVSTTVETIDGLRSLLELNEEIPVNLVNEERLVNTKVLFGSIAVPLPDVSAKNRLVDVSREDMLAEVSNMSKFIRLAPVQDSSPNINAFKYNKRTRETSHRLPTGREIYEEMIKSHTAKYKTLQPDQKDLYDDVNRNVEKWFEWERTKKGPAPAQVGYFVQGGAGCGKTYVTTLIAEKVQLLSRKRDLDRADCVSIGCPTAVASLLFPTGTTIHTLIGMVPSYKAGGGEKMVLRDLKNVAQGKRQQLLNTVLLICDEFSMITTDLGEKLDQRYREVNECQEFMGGVPIIIFVGDGRQLPPGIGGIKVSIMAATVFGTTELGRNLQKFVRKTLTVQNRAGKDDLWQAELLKHVNEVDYPITPALLASSCGFCLPPLPEGIEETPGDERNPVPTRECKHLHYFNKGIAKALPQLINAPVIYPGHSANEVSMVERIVAFAAFNNLPVFRWAKPAFGKKDNQNANMVYNLHNEFSNSAAIFPGLFGYFVQGLPVRVNHNASLEGRVVNGTMGTLHSLSPLDITEIDKKVAEAKKRDLSGSVAGTIIDISTPIGV